MLTEKEKRIKSALTAIVVGHFKGAPYFQEYSGLDEWKARITIGEMIGYIINNEKRVKEKISTLKALNKIVKAEFNTCLEDQVPSVYKTEGMFMSEVSITDAASALLALILDEEDEEPHPIEPQPELKTQTPWYVTASLSFLAGVTVTLIWTQFVLK